MSPSCKRIIGFSSEEMIGKANLETLCHPEDIGAVIFGLEDLISNQRPSIHLIFRMLTRYGKYLWMESKVHLIRRDDQSILLLQICRGYAQKQSIPKDIHDARTTAEVLESRFLAKLSIDGLFRWVSPSSTIISGHSPLELIGTNLYDYIHELDVSSIALAHSSACSTSSVQSNNGAKQVLSAFRFKMRSGHYMLCSAVVDVFKQTGTDQEQSFMMFNIQKIQLREGLTPSDAQGFKVYKEREGKFRLSDQLAELKLDRQELDYFSSMLLDSYRGLLFSEF